MNFFSTFGRLPNTWPNMAIIVLAGLAEGFGLALFVPLIELMTTGTVDGLKPPFSYISDAFRAVGLPVSAMAMVAGIAAVILASLGLAYGQRVLLVRARQGFKRHHRDTLLASLFEAGWGRIARVSHGEFVNVMITECDRASTALYHQVMCGAVAAQIAIYFAFSAALSWQLVLVTVVFGGLVVIVVRPLLRKARRLGGATDRANRDIGFHTVDFLKGAKLIKTTATERPVLARMADYVRASFSVAYEVESNAALLNFLIQMMPVLLITGIIALAHEVLRIEASLTLVFLLFLARFAPRVAQLQQSYQAYIVDCSALRTVDGLIAENRRNREPTGGRQFETLRDAIVFDHVGYRYDDEGAAAVADIDLTIRRNQMVAVVGVSGSGKSTLVELLAGLRRPQQGRILVDGTPLDSLDMASWRSHIGYVTQDVIVFNDTLRNNLLFARPDATDADIEQCLRRAQLWEFVRSLPDGLDTIAGEGGVRFSGGQRQRLALARALIGNPALLLLDEATSALDSESEQAIQQAVESIAHNVTIVVVAHRLSTVRRADLICVMENGRIVETGAYDALVARDGRFAHLHRIQAI